MASNYAIRVESDARDGDSYKLRVSRDGRTWNAVKDQAQLDAFHARATRLGATNGVAFSTKPSELEAYLSDVARHASSSDKAELVSSFLEADDDERGAERAFLEELAAVVKCRVLCTISSTAPRHAIDATQQPRECRGDGVTAVELHNATEGDLCNTTHESHDAVAATSDNATHERRSPTPPRAPN